MLRLAAGASADPDGEGSHAANAVMTGPEFRKRVRTVGKGLLGGRHQMPGQLTPAWLGGGKQQGRRARVTCRGSLPGACAMSCQG